MKKLILAFVSLILITCLGILLTWMFSPNILSYTLSKTVGARVTISKIQATQNGLKITGFKINNPPGYSKTPHALSINTIMIHTPWSRFFDKKIIIDSMILDTVYAGLEFSSFTLQKGNWTTLIENMKQSSPIDKKEDQKKNGDNPISILIKRCIVRNLQVELGYQMKNQPNKKLDLIDRIELKNISSTGGIPTTDLINLIMDHTFKKILSETGVQKMLDTLFIPNNGIKDGMGHVNGMGHVKGLFSHRMMRKPMRCNYMCSKNQRV